MVCLVLYLGFHSSVLILLMYRSMFLMSPLQPVPQSTPPVNLGFIFYDYFGYGFDCGLVL